MVNKTNKSAKRKNERDNIPFPTYTPYSRTTNSDKKHIDDLITSLANAYENKRARQVVEWELSQPSNIHRAV